MTEDEAYQHLGAAVIVGACRSSTSAVQFLCSKDFFFWAAVAGVENPEKMRDAILRKKQRLAGIEPGEGYKRA
jgi:hypothetical protein